MDLSAHEAQILRRELDTARSHLSAALETADPLETLAAMTAAVEGLTATQHELVNALLDRGVSWGTVADALSTNSAGARRRFPRRDSRTGAQDTTPPTS